MRIGFIISMYDEFEKVSKTSDVLKKENCVMILIQSDPKKNDKILDKNLVDYYEILPDLAGSKTNYEEERKQILKKGTTIPARALTRNYSKGFTVSKKFDVDWWIAILGDVEISSLSGVKKIIEKMVSIKKSIGVTRAIGQLWPNDNFELIRIQKKNTTDFMPQFFVVKDDLVKKGLFNNVRLTNRWASEQCFGDEIVRFCNENSEKYENMVYFICDYPYPKFIEGLKYNPVQAHWPRYIDAIVGRLFQLRAKLH